MTRVICFALLFPLYCQSSCYAQSKSLDYFLRQGLKNSPALNDIRNQISSNIVDSVLIKANRKPHISFNSSLYYAPRINGVGYDETITNLNNITSTLSLSHKIFNDYMVESEHSKIDIQQRSLRLTERISQNDLKKAITTQYLTTYSVGSEIDFNKTLLASSKEEEGLLHQLVEKGIYRQVDNLSFQVEVQGEELLIRDLQLQYRKEYLALTMLCGLQDTSYTELSLPEIKRLSTPSTVRSPFFTRFVVDSLRIQNEKSLVDANYRPSITWSLDAGIVNIVPNKIERNFGFSLGLNVALPLYDGGQRELNYQKLQIAEGTRESYFNNFKAQYYQQLHQLAGELNKTEETLQLARRQLALAGSIIQQHRKLLNTGNISIVDFVIALRNYISVKRNTNQYQVKVLQLVNEMNYWSE